MEVHSNFSLKKHNSFGIDAVADLFIHADSEEDIREVLKEHPAPMILGGGSNVLFVEHRVATPILKVDIRGIRKVFEDDSFAVVSAGAGEDWQDLVNFSLDANLGGIENLTLIPGKVGAAPIQNIGAYGVELKDCFYAVEAIEKSSGRLLTFNKEMCAFGYRNSVFKSEKKDQLIITRLFLRLDKEHKVKMDYGGIRMRLNTLGIKNPSIQKMAEVVEGLRRSKLPYPEQLPNAGSFFKNPVVSIEKLEGMQLDYPFVPFYEWTEGKVKLSAAWLIEQCGFKGVRQGDAGVYERHALILANYGNATGDEIYRLSESIMEAVKKSFDIELEREVNIVQ